MDLNGGVSNSNASSTRILTNFVVHAPALPAQLPSMAEALSVLASSTLVVGSLDTTYRHYWDDAYASHRLAPPAYEKFAAAIKTQQYTSTHEAGGWQAVFYLVLGLVFALNVVCFVYFALCSRGMVTDFTEPQNAFALAVNSPPSQQLRGTCGGGPTSRGELAVPWRVAYAELANHYFFEEARPSRYSTQTMASGAEALLPADGGRYSNSYKRLSRDRPWL